LREFEKRLTGREIKILEKLSTPVRIQHFLDSIPYSTESRYRSPLEVLRDKVAHCFDGALFAAMALRRIGHPSLIMDLIPNRRDDDHILALYRIGGYWGAVAKSNFTGLRYREPVYRTRRELVLSYFEQYYNIAGEKTLRGYSDILNLRSFDKDGWMYRREPLESIARRLDTLKRFMLLNRSMIRRLNRMDPRSYRSGLDGSITDGLYRP
jgi:hypothetical protein